MNLHKVRVEGMKEAARTLFRHLQEALACERAGIRVAGEHMIGSAYLLEQMKTDPILKGVLRGALRKGKEFRAEVRPPDTLPISPTQRMNPGLRATYDILRDHLEGRKFSSVHLDAFCRASNSQIREMVIQDSETQEIARKIPLSRLVAEDLISYLRYFWNDPKLRKEDPIRICRACGTTIFLQRTAKQVACSAKCRKDSWNTKKRLENPEYFNYRECRPRRK